MFDMIAFFKEYPMVAGAMSLWAAGVITFLIRYVPVNLFNFIKSQCITSLELNNAGWGGNQRQFDGFMKWYAASRYFKWSRYLSVDSEYVFDRETGRDNLTPVIGAGYGNHIFRYKGKTFWFFKSNLNSQGTEKEKQSIRIFTFGRNQRPILDLVEDFKVKQSPADAYIYTFKETWTQMSKVQPRRLETVVMDENDKAHMLGVIQNFYDNPDWFRSRGFPHKQTLMLHGVPGTGKSSMIRAFATHFNKNICLLDLADMSSSSFEKAMATVPKGAFVIMEDVDACEATHTRESTDETVLSRLSLSRVLNVLDGVVALDGVVVVMTTNHLEKLDAAFMRKGRVDHIYEVKPLSDTEIRQYIRLMYGESVTIPDAKFKDITGANIQAMYMEARSDYPLFLASLPIRTNTND